MSPAVHAAAKRQRRDFIGRYAATNVAIGMP